MYCIAVVNIAIYQYILVIFHCKDDIVVITRDQGGAEVKCNNNDII